MRTATTAETPPDNPRPPALHPRRRRILTAALAATAAASLPLRGDSDPAPPKRHVPTTSVTYTVQGNGTAHIAYLGDSDNGTATVLPDAKLPWTTTVDVPLKKDATLTVVLRADGTNATCTLAVAGQHRQRATATGPHGGTGKTTLARRLTDKHSFSLIHATRTPDHLDLTTRYLHMLGTDSRLVMDRSFISELVYGPLQRGRSRLTWAQVLDLAEAVNQRNGAFIHLTAPVDIVQARLLLRDGEANEPNALTDLLAAYERVFRTLADYVTVITIDTARHDLRSTG